MTEGEHTFTKTVRQRRASYASICRWIVDAWADISVSTVVRAFTKAGIITELPGNSSDTNSDNDEREQGMSDAVHAQTVQFGHWRRRIQRIRGRGTNWKSELYVLYVTEQCWVMRYIWISGYQTVLLLRVYNWTRLGDIVNTHVIVWTTLSYRECTTYKLNNFECYYIVNALTFDLVVSDRFLYYVFTESGKSSPPRFGEEWTRLGDIINTHINV